MDWSTESCRRVRDSGRESWNSPRSICPNSRKESRRRRYPPLYGEDIRIDKGSRIPECMKPFINKSGTAKEAVFRLLQKSVEMEDFFISQEKVRAVLFCATGTFRCSGDRTH